VRVTAEECPRIKKAFLEQERRAMPATQRDDTIEEFRDDLNARVEEREADLGRRRTDEDLAAILRQRG
jgi:hypothetical protein